MILPENILNLMRDKDRAALGKAGMTAAECHQVAIAKSERELQGQLVNLLRLSGVRFVLNQRFGVKTTAPKGTPDIVFAFHGVPCAWEVKMPGEPAREKPRPEQVQAMADMTTDGWRCAVIRSYDEGRAFLTLSSIP